MDGKVSKEDLIKAIEQVRPVIERIAQAQRQAIKDKFDRWARGEE
jgi:hypothetical protein